MRLVLVALVLASLGCAMKTTGGSREIIIGSQAPVPMTEMVALAETLRATVAELERTTDTTRRRELALRAMDLIKVLDLRLHDVMR
jgi:hypothetical protein